jgi:hypothetical protein
MKQFSSKLTTLGLALGLMLLCTACTSSTTKTATLISPASQQYAMKWDETVGATTTAKVNNSSLISMR